MSKSEESRARVENEGRGGRLLDQHFKPGVRAPISRLERAAKELAAAFLPPPPQPGVTNGRVWHRRPCDKRTEASHLFRICGSWCALVRSRREQDNGGVRPAHAKLPTAAQPKCLNTPGAVSAEPYFVVFDLLWC